MSAANPQRPYWSVDLPGLSEGGAERVVAIAAHEKLSAQGIVVDPAEALSIHLDRDTVEAVIEGLRAALAHAELEPERNGIVRGFLDILEDWSVR
jgi:hypothetical protein